VRHAIQNALGLAIPETLLGYAALALAATEDEEFVIHPEHVLRVVPLPSAQAWQSRLQKMDEQQRLADRDLLLSD
jgi:hypothetical protein